MPCAKLKCLSIGKSQVVKQIETDLSFCQISVLNFLVV